LIFRKIFEEKIARKWSQERKNRINPTQVGKQNMQRLQRLWTKELGKFLAYLRKKQAQNRKFWGHQRKGSNCLTKSATSKLTDRMWVKFSLSESFQRSQLEHASGVILRCESFEKRTRGSWHPQPRC